MSYAVIINYCVPSHRTCAALFFLVGPNKSNILRSQTSIADFQNRMKRSEENTKLKSDVLCSILEKILLQNLTSGCL